jgi:hypothetical protein
VARIGWSVIASLVVLGLAAPAPATTAAKGSGIKGRVVDATCYGPCVPGADPAPYSGEAEVVVRRLPRGRRVAELEVDESRYRKRLRPGRYRLEAEIEGRCWEGQAKRVRVRRGEFTRVRLPVVNECIRSGPAGAQSVKATASPTATAPGSSTLQ